MASSFYPIVYSGDGCKHAKIRIEDKANNLSSIICKKCGNEIAIYRRPVEGCKTSTDIMELQQFFVFGPVRAYSSKTIRENR